jgi:hypothetical protein
MTGRATSLILSFRTASEISRLHSSFHRRSCALLKQSCCIPHRLGGCDLITQERRIRHNQHSLRVAGHRPRGVNDRIQRDRHVVFRPSITCPRGSPTDRTSTPPCRNLCHRRVIGGQHDDRRPRFLITARSGIRTFWKLRSFSNFLLDTNSASCRRRPCRATLATMIVRCYLSLRGRLKSSRGSKPTCHQSDHGNVNECFGGLR